MSNMQQSHNEIMVEIMQDLELWARIQASTDIQEILQLKEKQRSEFDEYISVKKLRRCQGSHS